MTSQSNVEKVFYTDVAIIGGGPVGLFAVFQLGMLGLKAFVIDSLEAIGGQCAALYPEKPIYDIPAYPKILAGELIQKLSEQIEPFSPKFLLNNKVEHIYKDDEHNTHNTEQKFHLITDKGNKIYAKVVIIALGGGAFGPNRPLIDNIIEFEGRSVFYLVQDQKIFSGKNIVIAGGGDSAIDWALNLSEIANKIYIVHRRDKFKCAPETLKQVQSLAAEKYNNDGDKKIEFVIPYQLHALKHSSQKGFLESVDVMDFDNNIRSLKADILLPFFGLSMELGNVKSWGVALNENQKSIIVDQSTMQTNINGIFAVGDIADYKGKLKLILTGFAEVAMACHSAYSFINPNNPLHFEHSTTRGVQKIDTSKK